MDRGLLVTVVTKIEFSLVERQVNYDIDSVTSVIDRLLLNRTCDGMRPKDRALVYIKWLYCGKKKSVKTIVNYWQRVKGGKRELPELATQSDRTFSPERQHLNDICERVKSLCDGGHMTYEDVSRLLKDVIMDRIHAYNKSYGTGIVLDADIHDALEKLAEANRDVDDALRRAVASIIFGAGARLNETRTPAPKPVIEIDRHDQQKSVAELWFSAIQSDNAEKFVVKVVGAPGTGKRTLVARAQVALSSSNKLRRVYQYVFHSSLEATVAEALIGRNGQWPTDGRRLEEAKAALAKSPRPCSLVVTDVPDKEIEKEGNRRLLADLLARDISVILTVESQGESSKDNGRSTGSDKDLAESQGESTKGTTQATDSNLSIAEEVVMLGAPNTEELVQVSKSMAFQASCGLLSIDDRSANKLVVAAASNLKLVELASAVVGVGFSAGEVVEAMKQASLKGGPALDRRAAELLLLLFGKAHNAADRAAVALSILPPEGVCAIVLSSMGIERGSLLSLVETGFLVRDTARARYVVSGDVVRGALRFISASLRPFGRGASIEREVADHLWSLFQTGVDRNVVDELACCYENLISMFGEEQIPIAKGLWQARLSRMYGRLGRTWLCLKSDEIVLDILTGLNEGEAFDPDGPLEGTSGIASQLALARQYVKLGVSQMRYALRSEAIESFDEAIEISKKLGGNLEDELQARALREKGWTLHEIYKRDGRDRGRLNEAIKSKLEALKCLDRLSKNGIHVSGRQRQSVLSTLAFSLIEGEEEQRKKAPVYAAKGLLGLFAEVKSEEDSVLLILTHPEKALGNIVDSRDRLSVAEAVYFLGRVLGGGDDPSSPREGESDEERSRRLELSLDFVRAALVVREKELDEMNMTLAYNRASIGMILLALGKKREAEQYVWGAMKIQLSRFHCSVIPSGSVGPGKGFRYVPAGPITDACEKLFPGRLTRLGYELAPHPVTATAAGS